MNLQERLEEAKQRRAIAAAALSSEDRAELKLREEIAQEEQAAHLEELKARQLDLDRRLERARASLGSEARIQGVLLEEGFKDSFIVQGDGKAHAQWSNDTRQATMSQKGNYNEIQRNYALAVVYDWNGELHGDNPEFTNRLDEFLSLNPGIVSPIVNAAADLAGVFAAQRKS